MSKSKSLAAHYAHVHNGGIEFEIKKITDNFSKSHIRLNTQVSNFGCYTDTSVPLDATAAKWLIKSLTDLMPVLEKAENISDIGDEDLEEGESLDDLLSENSDTEVKNDLMNVFRAADDVAPKDGALKNGQAIPGGGFIKLGDEEMFNQMISDKEEHIKEQIQKRARMEAMVARRNELRASGLSEADAIYQVNDEFSQDVPKVASFADLSDEERETILKHFSEDSLPKEENLSVSIEKEGLQKAFKALFGDKKKSQESAYKVRLFEMVQFFQELKSEGMSDEEAASEVNNCFEDK